MLALHAGAVRGIKATGHLEYSRGSCLPCEKDGKQQWVEKHTQVRLCTFHVCRHGLWRVPFGVDGDEDRRQVRERLYLVCWKGQTE